MADSIEEEKYFCRMKSFKWKKFLNAPAAAAAIQRWGFPLSLVAKRPPLRREPPVAADNKLHKEPFTFSWLISQVSFLLSKSATAQKLYNNAN